MADMILSVCISSYNRAEICFSLVKRILKVKDERFNVIVCDDCSIDNTIELMQKIEDDRLTIRRNEENCGPCKNWYNTIDCGNGKYSLHILDRDRIDTKKLVWLCNLLEKIELAGGYICHYKLGSYPHKCNKQEIQIYDKGEEALLMFGGVPVHPTGFFIKTDLWKKGRFKKFFYEERKYGIYPHSYVFAALALKASLGYIETKFYETYNSNKNKSFFYSGNRIKDYWWKPENVTKNANISMQYILKFIPDDLKIKFICQRYEEGLYRATILYRQVAADKKNMERYGLQVRKILLPELLCAAIAYQFESQIILKRRVPHYYTEIRGELIKIWKNTLHQILKCYL